MHQERAAEPVGSAHLMHGHVQRVGVSSRVHGLGKRQRSSALRVRAQASDRRVAPFVHVPGYVSALQREIPIRGRCCVVAVVGYAHVCAVRWRASVSLAREPERASALLWGSIYTRLHIHMLLCAKQPWEYLEAAGGDKSRALARHVRLTRTSRGSPFRARDRQFENFLRKTGFGATRNTSIGDQN